MTLINTRHWVWFIWIQFTPTASHWAFIHRTVEPQPLELRSDARALVPCFWPLREFCALSTIALPTFHPQHLFTGPSCAKVSRSSYVTCLHCVSSTVVSECWFVTLQVGKRLMLHLLLPHYAPLTPVSREGPHQALFGSYWLFSEPHRSLLPHKRGKFIESDGRFYASLHGIPVNEKIKYLTIFSIVLRLCFELSCILRCFSCSEMMNTL